jgi:hypothetical protein
MLSSQGRASFAITALVLLALANAAAVHLAATHQAIEEQRRVEAERLAAEALLSAARLQVHVAASGAAEEASRASPGDPAAMASAFTANVNASLEKLFPMRSGEAEVRALGAAVSLLVESRTLVEPRALPPSAPKAISLGNATVIDEMSPHRPLPTRVPASFRVVGAVTLQLTAPGLERVDTVVLDQEEASPLPFLHGRVRAFARAVAGDTSEFADAVRYMLGTLVQFRILGGVGWGRYGVAGTTFADILTGADVEHAANLALLLEQKRVFRSFDRAQAAGLDASLGRPAGWTAALLSQFADGEVDPADLLLRLQGEGRTLPLQKLLAQALFASEDQSAQRFVDYVGLGALQDLQLFLAETQLSFIDALLEWGLRTTLEAEAVKGFLRSRLSLAGEDSLLGASASVSVPERSYFLPGSNVTITVAAATHELPLVPRDMMATEHNAFWKAYYDNLTTQLDRTHASFQELRKDVADKLAGNLLRILGVDDPELRLDPTDGLSALGEAAAALETGLLTAIADLRSRPDAVAILAWRQIEEESNATEALLRHVKAHYDAFVPVGETWPSVRRALAQALAEGARADPDFRTLSAEALSTLVTQIFADVDAGPWIPEGLAAMRSRDFGDLDRVALAAASRDVGAGGILGRILEALLGPGGLLLRAGDVVIASVRSLVGGELVPPEVLIPVPAGPFDLIGPAGNLSTSLAVDLGGYRTAAVATNAPLPPAGDLRVSLTRPDGFGTGAESPNTHFTRPWEGVARPFEAGWSVLLEGSLPVTLTANGTEVTAAAVRFAASAGLVGYSGGPLQSVLYESSNSLIADLFRTIMWVLDEVWPVIAEALEPVIDAVRALVRSILEAVMELADAARDLLQQMTELLNSAIDFARDLLDQLVSTVVRFIAEKVCPGSRASTAWSHGKHLQVLYCQPGGRTLTVRTEILGITAVLEILYLPDVTRAVSVKDGYDLLLSLSVDSPPIAFGAAFDARLATQPRVFQGTLVWDDAWAVDFEAGVVDPGNSFGGSLALPPIPTPFGTLDLSIGYEVSVSAPLQDLNPVTAIASTLSETLGDRGFPSSGADLEAFLRAFVQRFADRVVEWLEREAQKLDEVALYLEGTVGAAGSGLDLQLAVAFGGEAIRAVLDWFVQWVREFLEDWGALIVPVGVSALLAEILPDIYLRGQMGIAFGLPEWVPIPESIWDNVGVAVRLEANLPAVGALLAQDWGPWEVTFGAVVEGVPAPVAAGLGVTTGVGADFWLLRGVAHPL